MTWRRVTADGCEWEVRAIAAEGESAGAPGEDVLEFRAVGVIRPPRRTVIGTRSLDTMSDDELLAAYRRALPIGGDHYGRPGKRMPDSAP